MKKNTKGDQNMKKGYPMGVTTGRIGYFVPLFPAYRVLTYLVYFCGNISHTIYEGPVVSIQQLPVP